MFTRALGLAAATALVAGCGSAAQTETVQKQLRLSGPEAGLKRFASLQESRRPSLVVSEPKFTAGHDATAVVMLPRDYTGTELVQTTREALAAGLRYEYQEVRSTAESTS